MDQQRPRLARLEVAALGRLLEVVTLGRCVDQKLHTNLAGRVVHAASLDIGNHAHRTLGARELEQREAVEAASDAEGVVDYHLLGLHHLDTETRHELDVGGNVGQVGRGSVAGFEERSDGV